MTIKQVKKLEGEALSLQVAAIRGWTRYDPKKHMRCLSGWVDPDGKQGVGLRPPNYADDLNACAEFEEVITRLCLWAEYAEWLSVVKEPERWRINATASQRCKAFILTMGKVSDSLSDIVAALNEPRGNR